MNWHLSMSCKKNQKLHALSKVTNFMTLKKRRLLTIPFMYTQFKFCPLAWMCLKRKLNDKTNSMHEKALRIVYQDKKFFLHTCQKFKVSGYRNFES